MIQAFFKRILQLRELILILSLVELACLPIALSELIRDAGMSLLLPITLCGAVLAWALTSRGVRESLSGFALLILGPLALYIRIGQAGNSLFEFIKQIFILIPAFFKWRFEKIPFDPSVFLASRIEFLQEFFTLGTRVLLWFEGFFKGVHIEDPVVRTFIWSMVLWLIAIWAGWQIYRNKNFMAGILPSTALLIYILDYTGKEKSILWFHLALLLFLFGLTNYHGLLRHWNAAHMDYAESISVDILLSVGVITLGLVCASIFVFNFSIKDMLDNFREKRAASNETLAGSLGLKSVPIKENHIVTGLENGMPRSYLLTAGPELSKQLAMTITTGDLPPMPPSAQPDVPRYYWRTLTYSIYTGAGWTNPSGSIEDISANQTLIKPHPNDRVIHATVIFPKDKNTRLYWTGTLLRADVPFKAAWLHKSKADSLVDADMFAALATAKSYKAESVLLNVSAQGLRDSPSVYPDWVRKQFLTLPDSVPQRVLSLARDLTASESNAYERALAIQNYLRKFPYTLEIGTPPVGRDVVDYFVFDLKRGYCDYYATSMVVLARAAGLPARLVTGYANGSYDTQRAEYIVTENYAHSWVEIYFANIGWVEFEPTAGEPAIIYKDINQLPTPTAEVLPIKPSIGSSLTSLINGGFINGWVSIIFILFCGSLWIGFDSLRLHQMEPSRTIQILYKRFRRLGRPVSGFAARNQTALSYSLILAERVSAIQTWPRLQNWIRLSQNEIHQLTKLFSDSLFAPHSPTRADANAAIQTWSHLRWRLILANLLAFKKK